jgi:hypothetical protein
LVVLVFFLVFWGVGGWVWGCGVFLSGVSFFWWCGLGWGVIGGEGRGEVC